MHIARRLFNFVYEAVFLAPVSTYVLLSILLAGYIGWVVVRNYRATDFGFALIFLVLYFLVVNALLVALLVWRSASPVIYQAVTKKLFIVFLLLVIPLTLAAGFVDYNYQLDREIKQRDEWAAANEMYALDPDKRFNYSVPKGWIKTDTQLRQEVLRDSFGYFAASAMPLLLIILPLVLIKLARGGRRAQSPHL